MKTRTLLALAAGLALLPAAPAAAQAIRAGMSEAEVRSRLGEPDVVRGDDAWSYLFYANGCAVRCGSDDVVFLRDGRVVTAVFRTARRRFVGPEASDALEAAGGNLLSPSGSIPMRRASGAPGAARRAAPGQDAGRARVEGIRMVVPGSAGADEGDLLILPGDAVRAGAAGAGTRIESTLADTAMEQTARDRERNVTPRTVRPGNRDSAVADTALDQTRRDRERQVTPRTVRPRGGADAGTRPRPRPQAPGTPQP